MCYLKTTLYICGHRLTRARICEVKHGAMTLDNPYDAKFDCFLAQTSSSAACSCDACLSQGKITKLDIYRLRLMAAGQLLDLDYVAKLKAQLRPFVTDMPRAERDRSTIERTRRAKGGSRLYHAGRWYDIDRWEGMEREEAHERLAQQEEALPHPRNNWFGLLWPEDGIVIAGPAPMASYFLNPDTDSMHEYDYKPYVPDSAKQAYVTAAAHQRIHEYTDDDLLATQLDTLPPGGYSNVDTANVGKELCMTAADYQKICAYTDGTDATIANPVKGLPGIHTNEDILGSTSRRREAYVYEDVPEQPQKSSKTDALELPVAHYADGRNTSTTDHEPLDTKRNSELFYNVKNPGQDIAVRRDDTLSRLSAALSAAQLAGQRDTPAPVELEAISLRTTFQTRLTKIIRKLTGRRTPEKATVRKSKAFNSATGKPDGISPYKSYLQQTSIFPPRLPDLKRLSDIHLENTILDSENK